MTQAKTMRAPPPSTPAVGWQMWVPCIGMALCSWLSFVDRQVLNILAPTIIRTRASPTSTSPPPRRSSSSPTRSATRYGAR